MGAWTQSDADLIRTMWARGARSSDIVPLLSRQATRNAVMGMLNRLGIMGLGHPCEERLRTMDQVAELFGAAFSLGEPLHREAFLTLTCLRTGCRDVDGLALATGVCRSHCADFSFRLSIIWPEGSPHPERWSDETEGNLAFILDMAVIAGRLEMVPVRGRPMSEEAITRTGSPRSRRTRSGAMSDGRQAAL